MPPKVLLFTGAPPSSTLTQSSCTLDTFTKTFTDFLGQPSTQLDSSTEPSYATWRSLPLTRQPLHTGFSQVHDIATTYVLGNQTDFFTTASVSYDHPTGSFESYDAGDVLSQFWEHSLAVHNPVPSSQLESFDETSITDTSFLTTSSTGQPAAPPPLPSHLSDLEDIPSARQITALNPQTVTLNLIVGVISIAQPRTVTTRWGRTLSLVEILVGDDTKSGFAVTFWLENAAEGAVSDLRRQDVALLQNVALHVFRGKVYGQSLRRGMTKINLLWRRDGSGHYSPRDLVRKGALHPQLQKTRQVKDWVLKFVGADTTSETKTARNIWDKPPDDTQ
ncbi:Fc.00g038760.m01.CDS01 [Cosmosporella sp. VM-42]